MRFLDVIVAKFGGTSVSSSQRISTICKIVKNELDRKPVVVVSALSGVTDLLLSISNSTAFEKNKKIKQIKDLHFLLIKDFWQENQQAKEIHKYIEDKIAEIEEISKSIEFSKSTIDKLISYGEIMSSYIIAQALNSRGILSKPVIATELIVTDDCFGSSEFLLKPTKKKIISILEPLIKKGIVPVVTGFIGATKDGKTTTLGRGGSDYSASIIGFCLNAQEIQIWTDVNGIFTADPRIVKKAKKISTISYKEASELAIFGAKVLHPRTIRTATWSNIPVKVLNTFNIKDHGTLIVEKPNHLNPITAISSRKKITLINIYSTKMYLGKGFLAKVFDIFSKNNISVDLVSVSQVSISVTLDNDENLENAVKEISKFADVSVNRNLGTVTLVGEGISSSLSIIKQIFELFEKENIRVRMVSLGAIDINISLVINSEQVENAVVVLHDNLLLKTKNNNR